jgi:hypothetical protein
MAASTNDFIWAVFTVEPAFVVATPVDGLWLVIRRLFLSD